MLASDRISKTSINSLNIFIFITVYLTCISSKLMAFIDRKIIKIINHHFPYYFQPITNSSHIFNMEVYQNFNTNIFHIIFG